ncbi:TetR family transcriptional regulator [Variovorax saccharolyticus]|uniref:TetR family transcriptional regulator n=1 Tax=Variovorax saccharolyticus TaxID=3053516 RepID=UPI0025777AF7|nr:TetR family transcriptional regulator [Variovorax sp. J31P216]MDM0028409.1 TetR family transcriptional regulator [Variovorax sp. J31P216]
MQTKVATKKLPVEPRVKDPELARASLLTVAAEEFALRGFEGARLELIAQKVGITRAMIYYYFGGREGLYVAVLEDAYGAIWQAEHEIAWEGLDPEAALRALVSFRVGYYIAHPTFVALVSIENQHKAQHLKRAKSVMSSASLSLERTAAALAKGQADGVFRRDIDVVDLYQIIVSLAFFNVANQHTFGAIFGRDASDAGRVRRFVADAVLRYVAADQS